MTTSAKPNFVELPSQQLHIWECGVGPTILVLPGLIDSPQAACARVHEAFPGHRVAALELPGLGASPPSPERTVTAIASTVDAVAQKLNELVGCVAFDLSVPVALECSFSTNLKDRLLLVDLARARWLAQSKPNCGDFELDGDGTYLYKLWSHVRDVDMLESFEPRRPRGQGVYKSAEELDEAFLCFAVQPKEYAELWSCLASGIRSLGAEGIASATVVDKLSAADTNIFSGPALAVRSEKTSSVSNLVIKRGYEDISTGRIHYRKAGTSESCVVALVPGPFSSSLLSPLLLNLSGHHTVVVADFIGQGDSCRSTTETTIARTAVEIDELTRKLGWSRYSIYGTQTGAGVALETAIAFADRVKALVIDSCSMQHAWEREEHRARYFPSVTPDVWGSHVFQTWNVLKDGEVFWPWYLPVCASAKESTSTGLGRLHDSVICTLRSRTTPVYKSMSSYEARNRVSLVRQPVLFVTGPKDIFKSYMPEAKKLAPENFSFLDVPATIWAAKADPQNVKKTCDLFDTFFLNNN